MPLNIIVVDDSARFPLYVWRYLSRSVGFGIGRATSGCFGTISQPAPLETPCLQMKIWWVDALHWQESLEPIWLSTKNEARHFLVDVRGPYTEGTNWEKVVKSLRQGGRKVRPESIWLVSSYQTGPQELPGSRSRTLLSIHPKSPETLERLPKFPGPMNREPEGIHILVSGAGCEFKDGDLEFRRLGTQLTGAVIKALVNDKKLFAEQPAISTAKLDYPKGHQSESFLATAAEKGNLDAYWSELLRLELQQGLKAEDFNEEAASRRELDLRNSFRNGLLADDWGFLGQYAKLFDAFPTATLAAWLTTNYTRFADRAIEAAIANRKTEREWRIVSTSEEAERLAEELLHHGSAGVGNRPYLFKLHGDIAHPLSMAIAGYDKRLFTPLSLRITSMHSLYIAAEQFLLHRLCNSDQPVYWHIIGHGLQDQLLVSLIKKVIQGARLKRGKRFIPHRLFFVGPFAKSEVAELGKDFLPGLLPIELQADQYVARLARLGLPERPNSAECTRWIKRIEKGMPTPP
jgi:hypothetical protein